MSPLEPVLRPITRARLHELAESGFGDMIKAVVDCARRVMVVGGELHADEEQWLLDYGSQQEVSRALRARASGHEGRERSALRRFLELMDLTIADARLRGRRRELCRAREVVCDYFVGDNVYRSTPESLDRYFLAFAKAARQKR